MEVYSLMTNRMVNPLGFELGRVRLSYKVRDTQGRHQLAAQIRISQEAGMRPLCYDSGRREDIDSLGFEPELQLSAYTRYYWTVEVWADNGDSAVSEPAWFETAKLDEKWDASWITGDIDRREAQVLTRGFSLQGPVAKARVYACGLGLYELYLNGQKAGEEFLAPDCNAYDKWLQYQTYDVTPLLLLGDNLMEVMLADGWYKGRFGFLEDGGNIYGDQLALILELHVTYESGQREVILSDNSWEARRSPVRFSNIYDGEHFDAAYQPETVYGVKPVLLGFERLQARLSLPVKIKETIKPLKVITTPAGETVLDMGQEITGWLSFKTQAPAGTRLKLSYGEILQGGNFYRDNLRTARAEFEYVSDGQAREVRPHFTFYGFRYVKLEGFELPIELGDFTGCVLYSDIEQRGSVETSNPKVNRLCLNALWGQKGNFLDVPTDCPQRDERMGWTGDAQAFSGAACFNMECAAFFRKFLYDMKMEQDKLDGAVPYVVPVFNIPGSASCAWADAATIIPWNSYLFYGDLELLRQQYRNMKDWVDWIWRTDEESGGHRLWTVGFHYGDWLALDAEPEDNCIGGTDVYFIASAFYYYSATLLVKAARALGYEQEVATYEALCGEIREAFQREFFTATGRLAVTTQTAYVVALHMGLTPEAFVPRVQQALRDKLMANKVKLKTGFVGTSYLNRVLSGNGSNDLAYQLLLGEDYPGWLYAVNMGATTVWERWNSVLPDGSLSGTGMNSLNHYAYGAIVEWIFRDVAGINPVEEAPGFRRALIRPRPNYRLPAVRARYESAVGLYESAWIIREDGTFHLEVTIPFGATAQVVLPYGDAASLTVNGQGARALDCPLCAAGDDLALTLPSGRYSFDYRPTQPLKQVFTLDTLLGEVRGSELAWQLLLAEVPGLRELPDSQMDLGDTVRKLLHTPFLSVSDEQAQQLDERLRAL